MPAPRIQLIRTALADRVQSTLAEYSITRSGLVLEALAGNETLDHSREQFCALHLDARHKPTAFEIISVGSLTASLVHPREVFKSALLNNAAALILVHNHPTGNPSPSKEDDDITQRLVDAGQLLGIQILDHIIVTPQASPGEGYYSYMDRGTLPKSQARKLTDAI